eukprot:TRINITY_DN3919_c0_g1_i1.p1 TRINITY_DN3919_c0_g1~~TRINITY_DN3919_c0_g1_i1.p1  ORF type:complete len:212 (-),score=76.95 TRINITY_DN3919_c0_g1_i1:39-674(-)
MSSDQNGSNPSASKCKNKALCYIEHLKNAEQLIRQEISKMQQTQRRLVQFICSVQLENNQLKNAQEVESPPKEPTRNELVAEKICECIKDINKKDGECPCIKKKTMNDLTQQELEDGKKIYDSLVKNIDENLENSIGKCPSTEGKVEGNLNGECKEPNPEEQDELSSLPSCSKRKMNSAGISRSSLEQLRRLCKDSECVNFGKEESCAHPS